MQGGSLRAIREAQYAGITERASNDLLSNLTEDQKLLVYYVAFETGISIPIVVATLKQMGKLSIA
jgi:hypothetical protein